MRTKKKYTIPKPDNDFININTSFTDRMKHFDDEKNGQLNLVVFKKNNSINKKSKTI